MFIKNAFELTQYKLRNSIVKALHIDCICRLNLSNVWSNYQFYLFYVFKSLIIFALNSGKASHIIVPVPSSTPARYLSFSLPLNGV